MKLADNTILITGGATGIGYAFAEAFLDAGSTVLICGRRAEKLQEAKTLRPALHIRMCDVSKEMDRIALAEWTARQFPAVNVLINNAGIQRDIDFTQGSDAYQAGENEIRVNLEAPIVLTGLFVPLLAKKPGAAIIHVTSGLGFVPMVRMPVYSATKAALHAYSLATRPQLAKVGIRVVEVVPPMVDTDLNPEGRAARGHFKANLGPKEFVTAVMKGLEADTAEIGYGMTAGMLQASRADLDKAFQHMNNR
jgi:uncharacterized oxidoreductase